MEAINISQNENFKTDHKLSDKQRLAISDYYEHGVDSEDAHLSKEQLSKIPDFIDNYKLSKSEKFFLATESLDLLATRGVQYSINDNGNIERTIYDDDINPIKDLVKNKEVKFNTEITINNTLQSLNEHQVKNFNYLKDQLKYLGFGNQQELELKLASKINRGDPSFELDQKTDKNFFKSNQISFTLNFNKAKDTGTVFLNSYMVNLENREKNQNVSFDVDLRKIPFTSKEAINLIEGRSVRTDINLRNGKKEDVFVKIDFQNPNEKGKYNLNKFFPNYGINTIDILKKSNTKLSNSDIQDKIVKSLEKGNVVPLLINNNGKTEKLNAVLNPQFKTLNLYDFRMQRVNLSQTLVNSTIPERKNIENNEQQTSQRKI